MNINKNSEKTREITGGQIECAPPIIETDDMSYIFDNKPKIKDSGKTREFETGAHRDFAEGKGRCDLVPLDILLKDIDYINNVDTSKGIQSIKISALKRISELAKHGYSDFVELRKIAVMITIALGMEENEVTKEIKEDDNFAYFSYGVLQVSKHYEEGATKYGENNWRKGMKTHIYVDSCERHLLKSIACIKDEPHTRAALWNIIALYWTKENKPELDDLKRDIL